jgi:hypothetical protein
MYGIVGVAGIDIFTSIEMANRLQRLLAGRRRSCPFF